MEKRVTAGSWILTFILLAIPGLDLIYLLGLAIGISSYKSKVSYARAILILMILGIIGYIIYLAVMFSIANNGLDFKAFGEYLQAYGNSWVEYFKGLLEQIQGNFNK